ncbi:metalloprotease [Coemansia sp. RSA 518]|nr:metalloprotease [Coemansia sp. RSA 560]KAJ2200807.1 metalloprotease [Coemansia sp. RSA 521]KAJ2207831.1 metalloprotease [Coemansia sp. RSA 520]KAJ2212145.1 metalloprotease [Coemansia sp. RSA 518]KAJ2234161.1 metalloprotease [Coemansia sp. RSA 475]KAJ2274769.1 metalloprotease [Coemansia sp. RSA 371]KAJ2409599.1 metalloprotease [Coemansia sp. RSA 2526]KAJ2839463.1 metalloprotease [Coemansia erecta]
MSLLSCIGIAACLTALLLLRIYFVLPAFGRDSKYASKRRKGKATVRASADMTLCVVLGSGGHTAEMMRLLQGVEFDRYMQRLYVVGDSDALSLDQIGIVERRGNTYNEEYFVERVPRSREVGQPWLTTPLSVARCLVRTASIFLDYRPDVVLCNGPGNCVVACVVALVPRILGLKRIPIIYVESFARVRTLSLSGKILYLLADRFIVQWPGLVSTYPRAEYIPHLV